MPKRELWEMLVDVLSSLQPQVDRSVRLWITDVALDLPVDMRAAERPDRTVLYIDLPDWRWNSGFQANRGRLRLVCGPVDNAADQAPEERDRVWTGKEE